MRLFNIKQSGYTLVELLVVISVMSILMGFVISNLLGGRIRARDAQRKSDLREIQSALEMYRADLGNYPLTANFPACTSSPNSLVNGSTTYMVKIPCDPLKTTTSYTYTASGTCGTGACSYTLDACLENVNDQDSHNKTDNACTAVNGTSKKFHLDSP